MLTIVVSIVAIGVLVLVLDAIVRFSIVSPLRTRNMAARVHELELPGVEQACGFAPPADLVRLYSDGS